MPDLTDPAELSRIVTAVFGELPELDSITAPVVVGVSGGADSLALLACAVAQGLDPIAVHVDHGLRDRSPSDAAVVERIAAGFGVRTVVQRVHVGADSNLEARAREQRYAALERARAATGATAILIGHTADDQAETVVLALLRGSGSAGLAGMAPRHGAVVRPLLGARRAHTVELCARLGLAPLDDPMNSDTAFRRVWIRREVLPMLERGAGRDLVPVLVRQAEILRGESGYLDAAAACAWPDPGDDERPRTAALRELPTALARRAVRSWLGAPPPSLAEVDAVLAVARNERRAVELAGGRRVGRRGGRLFVDRGDPVAECSVLELTLPGTSRGFGLALESWVERDAPARWPDGRWTCVVDADTVGGAAHLYRRPSGGRIELTSTTGEPVWSVGYRVAGYARVSERTRRYLWITAVPVTAEEG